MAETIKTLEDFMENTELGIQESVETGAFKGTGEVENIDLYEDMAGRTFIQMEKVIDAGDVGAFIEFVAIVPSTAEFSEGTVADINDMIHIELDLDKKDPNKDYQIALKKAEAVLAKLGRKKLLLQQQVDGRNAEGEIILSTSKRVSLDLLGDIDRLLAQVESMTKDLLGVAIKVGEAINT